MRGALLCSAMSAVLILVTASAFGEPADKAGTDASRITLDVKDMPLEQVVEMLAQLSGNKPFKVADPLKEKAVTVSVKDLPYWEAVDRMCEAAGLLYNGNWGEEVPTLVEADSDAKLNAYAGPFVVKLDSATEVLSFRLVKPKAPAAWGREGTTYTLTYFWEDRLQPICTEIELTRAVTPEGKDVLPADARMRKMTAATARAGNKYPACYRAMFPMQPAGDAKKLSEVSGVMRMEFGAGDREVVLHDVVNAVGKTIAADDRIVTIKYVDRSDHGLQLVIEVKHQGQVVPMPASWQTDAYGWFVTTGAGGQRVRGFGAAGYVSVRPWAGGGNETPIAKDNIYLRFRGDFAPGASDLVLVLPKTHETREYPFAIKDVPVP